MIETRAPRGAEWADVSDVLHTLSNVMTVRAHYAEGHPAIARADAAAAAGFARLLERVPEIVVAFVDGEFVVSERPLPELRARLGALAEAMTRHEIDCIVFQRGVTAAECSVLGRTLNTPLVADPAKLRAEAQVGLSHVLLRFAVLKASDVAKRQGAQAEYLAPDVGRALYDAARAIADEKPIDRVAVRAIASRIVAACNARAFAIEPRAYAAGVGDLPAHATNVALMTAAMALEAGYPEAACVEAAAAAILHDVGQIFLPLKIRGVPEPLLAEEDKARFRDHSAIGACALLGAGCPPLWVAAALEHHRGVDGAGYPPLEARPVPHELVRMISLASFFDRRRTLLNGRGDDPEEALARATALEDRYFGASTVRLFLRALGVHPPGTIVELSTREAAVVVNANPADPMRPQVRPLFGPNEGKLVDLKDLNAVEDRHARSIARAIAPPLAVIARDAEDEREDERDEEASEAADDDRALIARAPQPAPAPKTSSAPPTRASVRPSARPSIPREEPAAPTSDPTPAGTTSPRGTVPPRGSLPPRTLPPRVSLSPRTLPPRTPEPEEPDDSASLGAPDAVPRVLVSVAELQKLNLDPRAGFILTFIDGTTTLETIYDSCGLSESDAKILLAELVLRGVIEIG